jgi:amino acid transporter
VACFAVLALAPRRRPSDLRGLGWLVVPATLVATLGPPKYEQSPLLLAIVAIAAILVVVYAIAMLSTDPRVAIAGAVPLSSLGLGVTGSAADAVALLFLAAAPVVLAVTVTRIRHLRRRAPL